MSLKIPSFKTLAFILIYASFCLVVSLSCFSMLYFFYIPKKIVKWPLYFNYNKSFNDALSKISYSFSLENLSDSNCLWKNQPYDIFVSFKSPELPNLTTKYKTNFMIHFSLYDSSDQKLYESFRPGLFRYVSPIVALFKKVIYLPFLILGLWDESIECLVFLAEGLIIDCPIEENISKLRVQIELDRPILLNSADLHFVAKFRGVRYALYYWPLTSAIVSCSLLWFTTFVFGISLYYIKNGPKLSEENMENIIIPLIHETFDTEQESGSDTDLGRLFQEVGVRKRNKRKY